MNNKFFTFSDKIIILGQLIQLLENNIVNSKNIINNTQKDAIEAPGAMQSHHDTSKFESSYLFKNLNEKFQMDLKTLSQLKGLALKETQVVEIGSIVEIESGDIYYILPGGGGNLIEYDGKIITIISNASPLFKIIDKHGLNSEIILPSKIKSRIVNLI